MNVMFQGLKVLFVFFVSLSVSSSNAESALVRPMNFSDTGDQIRFILQKGSDSDGQYVGLMRNSERLVFAGEVKQTSGGRAPVHFFRDERRIYALYSGGLVVPIPNFDQTSLRTFETFSLTANDRGPIKKGMASFWSGLRATSVDGKVHDVWVSSFGDFFYPPADGNLSMGVTLKHPPNLPNPYVRIEDFLSWHNENQAVSREEKSVFQIFAVTPDDTHEMVFDHLEVRPEPERYRVYEVSRALGRSDTKRYYSIFGHTPQYFLSTVYHEFKLQTDRPAFDEKLLAQIQGEDRKLGADRMVYVWASDENSRIPGGIRLFQGYESKNFISKDLRLPVERQYPHLDIRGRFPGESFYEFNRLTVRKELAPWLSTKRLVNLMLEYMTARNLPSGRFVIHTDEKGAVLYRRFFDATVEFTGAETGDGTVVLSVKQADLFQRVKNDGPKGLTAPMLRTPKAWCASLLSPI